MCFHLRATLRLNAYDPWKMSLPVPRNDQHSLGCVQRGGQIANSLGRILPWVGLPDVVPSLECVQIFLILAGGGVVVVCWCGV